MTLPRVHEWFAQVAESAPERIAFERGASRLNYRELNDRANALANRLNAEGIKPGARVAILADNVGTVLTAVIACLKGGYVFVPLDPRIPERRLRTMVGAAAVECFIIEPAFAEAASRIACPDLGTPRLVVIDSPEDLAAGDRTPVAIDRDPNDCAYIYFTSGSTGIPKGIAGRLRAIDHFVRWEIKTFGLSEGVRVSQLTTPSFDASLRDFFAPLCAGGTVCAPESADLKLDAPKLMAWLDEQRINLLHCVPSVFRLMLNEGLEAKSFGHLRHVLMAGEAILPADVRRWTDVYGDRIQLVNLYGPSETTMTKFFHVVTRADADRPSVPIGVPMEGAGGIVVDDMGRPCPRGVVGEIWIRTPFRSLGYYGRDDLTKQVFIPNPFGSDPNDLVYKTGDLGRILSDGSFELVGRKDHQVKVRGERIELGAVEAALRRHEAVTDVAVVDLEDAAGIKYLCAYTVTTRPLVPADLKAFLGKDLSPAMVPTSFVTLDRLPRTISGKIDRHALPPPSDAEEARSELAESELPQSPVEEALAAVFAEVLGRGRVGVHQNFFELGGHSLLATRLVSRVRVALGVDLALRTLFEAPTVAGLARHVAALQWALSGVVDDAPDVAEFRL